MAKKNTYNASSIKNLSQHNHLLKRLSLTFGRETGDEKTPYSSQKSVAIREIIDNGFDEVIGNHADRVKVSYFKDGSFQVEDNGRGLPVDVGQLATGESVSGIYLCLGVIQSGGKFETDGKRFGAGLNGVGASSTVHTSKRTDVEVFRNNKIYKLSFKDGEPGFFSKEGDPDSKFTPLTDLTYIEECKDDRSKEEKKNFPHGTKIRTWLRDSVYSSKYPVDTVDLTERLRGTAYLIPGVTVEVHDEINEVEDSEGNLIPYDETFSFTGGIPELVETNFKKPQLTEIFNFTVKTSYIEKGASVLKNDKVVNEDVERAIEMDVAFGWDQGFDYDCESYVNTIRTRLGGVHETAFEKSLVKAFGDRFRSMQGVMTKADPELEFSDFEEGLVVVISARVSEPEFSGQAKEELSGTAVRREFTKALTEEMEKFANAPKNLPAMRIAGEKVAQAARNRQAQRDQQEINRKKNAIEKNSTMPDKLIDCDIVGTENSELYIIEGDSAKDSLKAARISAYQALFPLKGKLISATKNDMKAVLANKEVQGIIQAMGCGIGADCDPSKSRYGRVVIATDADPDGGNIAALIFSFFWTYMRPIIEEGMLYMVNTPLFVITENPTAKVNKQIRHYAYTEEERDDIISTMKNKKYGVQRLKGLGEGGKDILSDTAMDPLTRDIDRIVIKDEDKTEAMVQTIFGEDIDIRRDWIEANPMNELELSE